jgi:methyl-accepting chemotaxis protein
MPNISNFFGIGGAQYRLKGIDLSTADYISYVNTEQKIFVSEPHIGFFGYPAVVVAVPIAFESSLFGVLCGTLKLNILFNSAIDLEFGHTGFAMVVDRNGVILSHPDPHFILQKRIAELEVDNPSLQILWNKMVESKEGVLKYTYQGQEYIAGYTPIGINEWFVLVTIPLKEVLTDVEKLKITALILTVFFLGLTIWSVFLVSRSISRPLVSVTHEVQTFVGSTIENIKTQGKDEVSILVASMRRLVSYLQEMALVANSISQGDPSLQIEPKSEGDILGHAFNRMTLYFREMIEVANRLAKGDFRQTIPPKSEKDALGYAFQNMVNGWRGLVSEIQSNADQITEASEQILSRSEQDLLAAEAITSSAEETGLAMAEMKASAEGISENTKTLFSSTEGIVSATDQMFSAIKQVAHSTEELSELADITEMGMNEMVISVMRVTKNAEDSSQFYRETTEISVQGQDSVRQVVDSMEKIRQMVSSATQTIESLEAKSQEIGMIVEVIDGIADQTALLALNASILAAQAGEYGRGFAVVAEEIKNLANRVALSTKEITQIIQGIQKQSVEAAQIIRKGGSAVEEGVRLVHQAGESLNRITVSAKNSWSVARDIAQTVQEQRSTVERIKGSLERVTERINEINSATQEQEAQSSQVLQIVDGVKGLMEQVKRMTIEQAKGTYQVNIAMEGVKNMTLQNTENARQSTGAAERLASQAEVLRKLVSRFILSGD